MNPLKGQPARPAHRLKGIRVAVAGPLSLSAMATACASTKPTASQFPAPIQLVNAALTKTSHTESFRVSLDLTSQLGPTHSSAIVTGVVDLRSDRLQLIATTATTYETIDTISIGHDLWQSGGAPNAWHHQTISNSTQLYGWPLANPAQFFTALQANLTDLVRIGTARVDGVDTSHYRGVESQAVGANRDTATVNLWISADDLIRQLNSASQLTMAAAASTGGTDTITTTQTFDLKLTNFGTPTNIQPPPASEVTGNVAPSSG